MYKITFKFKVPLVYLGHEKPCLDAILSYCEYREKYYKSNNIKTPSGKELKQFNLDFLRKNKHGFYETSYIFCDKAIEDSNYWRKRWECKFEQFLDNKKNINTKQGLYKSYNVRFTTYSINEGWFYFNGDIEYIDHLVNNNLIGIGKKVKIGFGWVNSFDIKEVGNSNCLYYRTLPFKFGKEFCKNNNIRYDIQLGSYRVPYWHGEYEPIIYPKVSNVYDC